MVLRGYDASFAHYYMKKRVNVDWNELHHRLTSW